jgi:gp32 DNA binding protein like
MSFADLKKNQGLAGAKKLQDALENLNKKSEAGSSDDTRFWKLAVDKSGVGAAVIRFLPESDGDSLPWVLLYEHAFKGPGGWYIEKSRTTLGKSVADPVFEYNNQLWNSGIDANKELARKQKRTPKYVSNILVVKDPANPDNEGKVFLFKYGKKLFQKIQEAMIPEPDPVDQKEPVNPFCPWKGANFKLKCRKVDGYPNYDQSDFATPEAILGGDDKKIEALWKTQHKLSELVDPANFKSYEDLKKRLDRVLGLSAAATVESAVTSSKTVTKPSLVESASDVGTTEDDLPASFTSTSTESDDDISDDLSYLQQLANED